MHLPFTVVHLTDPAARKVYSAENVLIRPDQHVAWRGTELPPGGAASVLNYVLGFGTNDPARQFVDTALAASTANQ